MIAAVPLISISPRDYDAVLFDLDGVLTDTASVHSAAWKKTFDNFLKRRAANSGEPFVPFESDDYLRHVDGKPRLDGIADFLASRGISLPQGDADDPPEADSIHALGNLKEKFFSAELQEQGVQVYPASIQFVRDLRAQEFRIGVVSASAHCEEILHAAGIADLFDARVDGRDVIRLKLSGKPAPDSFLMAARRLAVEPPRTVVVEDAIAGLQAAHAGGFGCVIAIDHHGNGQALREAGADAVIAELSQVRVAVEPPSAWKLEFDDFVPDHEGVRESLCALGNGYFTTRGAALDASADDVHYPGTYLAGGYNRLRTDIGGLVVENEDLVNLPNWLPLRFRVGNQSWFSTRNAKLLSYRQELDLRRGMLLRSIRFEDDEGRISTLKERRLVSMHHVHLCAIELSLTAENWSADVEVLSAIDGCVINSGAGLYSQFNKTHLVPDASRNFGPDGICLGVRTSQSNLYIAQACRTRALLDGQPVAGDRQTISEPGKIGQQFSVAMKQGQTLRVEKLVALYTSRDPAISEAGLEARKRVARIENFDSVMAVHLLAWKHLWRRFDVHIKTAGPWEQLNVPMLLRLNMFHLLAAVSPNSVGLDIGVPARGWTGEHYQGHIFWDELFIFPFFNYRLPEITRSLLLYRYRRLPEARAAAAAGGYRGAMFPWQSGSDGREETQVMNRNPRSGRWVPDNSYLQRHVGSAIAYNVWQYYQVTQDVEFMHAYGAELVLDIALFWSTIATLNEQTGRYEIRGVMGPDEFHEAYPDAHIPGLNNNAYTNVMAVWVLCRALDVLNLLSDIRRVELTTLLGITPKDVERWEDISRRMTVPFLDGGIIAQFEGYEKLLEFDWEAYRTKYGNIQRLDLILEGEDDSANRYRVSKQADVLMLFYLLSSEELSELFARLGYELEDHALARNVAYYIQRSSHGSTLSRVVHAWVLARSDRERAMDFLAEALQSDVNDIQKGTTAEGVHLGAMAGAVDLIQRVTTGIEIREDELRLNPRLPPEIAHLDMRVRYRGHSLSLRLTCDSLTVRGRDGTAAPIRLRVNGEHTEFRIGDTRVFPLAPRDQGR